MSEPPNPKSLSHVRCAACGEVVHLKNCKNHARKHGYVVATSKADKSIHKENLAVDLILMHDLLVPSLKKNLNSTKNFFLFLKMLTPIIVRGETIFQKVEEIGIVIQAFMTHFITSASWTTVSSMFLSYFEGISLNQHSLISTVYLHSNDHPFIFSTSFPYDKHSLVIIQEVTLLFAVLLSSNHPFSNYEVCDYLFHALDFPRETYFNSESIFSSESSDKWLKLSFHKASCVVLIGSLINRCHEVSLRHLDAIISQVFKLSSQMAPELFEFTPIITKSHTSISLSLALYFGIIIVSKRKFQTDSVRTHNEEQEKGEVRKDFSSLTPMKSPKPGSKHSLSDIHHSGDDSLHLLSYLTYYADFIPPVLVCVVRRSLVATDVKDSIFALIRYFCAYIEENDEEIDRIMTQSINTILTSIVVSAHPVKSVFFACFILNLVEKCLILRDSFISEVSARCILKIVSVMMLHSDCSIRCYASGLCSRMVKHMAQHGRGDCVAWAIRNTLELGIKEKAVAKSLIFNVIKSFVSTIKCQMSFISNYNLIGTYSLLRILGRFKTSRIHGSGCEFVTACSIFCTIFPSFDVFSLSKWILFKQELCELQDEGVSYDGLKLAGFESNVVKSLHFIASGDIIVYLLALVCGVLDSLRIEYLISCSTLKKKEREGEGEKEEREKEEEVSLSHLRDNIGRCLYILEKLTFLGSVSIGRSSPLIFSNCSSFVLRRMLFALSAFNSPSFLPFGMRFMMCKIITNVLKFPQIRFSQKSICSILSFSYLFISPNIIRSEISGHSFHTSLEPRELHRILLWDLIRKREMEEKIKQKKEIEERKKMKSGKGSKTKKTSKGTKKTSKEFKNSDQIESPAESQQKQLEEEISPEMTREVIFEVDTKLSETDLVIPHTDLSIMMDNVISAFVYEMNRMNEEKNEQADIVIGLICGLWEPIFREKVAIFGDKYQKVFLDDDSAWAIHMCPGYLPSGASFETILDKYSVSMADLIFPFLISTNLCVSSSSTLSLMVAYSLWRILNLHRIDLETRVADPEKLHDGDEIVKDFSDDISDSVKILSSFLKRQSVSLSPLPLLLSLLLVGLSSDLMSIRSLCLTALWMLHNGTLAEIPAPFLAPLLLNSCDHALSPEKRKICVDLIASSEQGILYLDDSHPDGYDGEGKESIHSHSDGIWPVVSRVSRILTPYLLLSDLNWVGNIIQTLIKRVWSIAVQVEINMERDQAVSTHTTLGNSVKNGIFVNMVLWTLFKRIPESHRVILIFIDTLVHEIVSFTEPCVEKESFTSSRDSKMVSAGKKRKKVDLVSVLDNCCSFCLDCISSVDGSVRNVAYSALKSLITHSNHVVISSLFIPRLLAKSKAISSSTTLSIACTNHSYVSISSLLAVACKRTSSLKHAKRITTELIDGVLKCCGAKSQLLNTIDPLKQVYSVILGAKMHEFSTKTLQYVKKFMYSESSTCFSLQICSVYLYFALLSVHGLSCFVKDGFVQSGLGFILTTLNGKSVNKKVCGCIMVEATIFVYGSLVEPFIPLIVLPLSRLLCDSSDVVSSRAERTLQAVLHSLSVDGIIFLVNKIISTMEGYKTNKTSIGINSVPPFFGNIHLEGDEEEEEEEEGVDKEEEELMKLESSTNTEESSIEWQLFCGCVSAIGYISKIAPEIISFFLPTLIPFIRSAIHDARKSIRDAISFCFVCIGDSCANSRLREPISQMVRCLLGGIESNPRTLDRLLDELKHVELTSRLKIGELSLLIPLLMDSLSSSSVTARQSSLVFLSSLPQLSSALALSSFSQIMLYPLVDIAINSTIENERRSACYAISNLQHVFGERLIQHFDTHLKKFFAQSFSSALENYGLIRVSLRNKVQIIKGIDTSLDKLLHSFKQAREHIDIQSLLIDENIASSIRDIDASGGFDVFASLYSNSHLTGIVEYVNDDDTADSCNTADSSQKVVNNTIDRDSLEKIIMLECVSICESLLWLAEKKDSSVWIDIDFPRIFSYISVIPRLLRMSFRATSEEPLRMIVLKVCEICSRIVVQNACTKEKENSVDSSNILVPFCSAILSSMLNGVDLEKNQSLICMISIVSLLRDFMKDSNLTLSSSLPLASIMEEKEEEEEERDS
ncbi:hypothetical protein ADUPG1_008458 [Aduncisulcus paluster]|uniref:Uncharacterized protein n=1 Tax=Aduncisulcus paluster TaxID=2918883 RepID=A0ABQ5KTB3_9EUKA|nr:hypothetical protein ADUPG1_008458 [Aduncisulcus paluster]